MTEPTGDPDIWQRVVVATRCAPLGQAYLSDNAIQTTHLAANKAMGNLWALTLSDNAADAEFKAAMQGGCQYEKAPESVDVFLHAIGQAVALNGLAVAPPPAMASSRQGRRLKPTQPNIGRSRPPTAPPTTSPCGMPRAPHAKHHVGH